MKIRVSVNDTTGEKPRHEDWIKTNKPMINWLQVREWLREHLYTPLRSADMSGRYYVAVSVEDRDGTVFETASVSAN